MDSKEQINKSIKNRKIRNILLLVVVLLAISVGFALLSQTLSIHGVSTISSSTWNVHFANLHEVTGSVTPDVEATIADDKLNISYTITLDKPGDYYAFTVDVENTGTIDAQLEALPTITGVSAEQEVYTNYTFTHTDGTPIVAGEVIEAGDSTNFTVRVEYDKNITTDSELPKTNQSMELEVDMTYVQK